MACGKSLTMRAIQPPSPRMFWNPTMPVKRNGEAVPLGPYVDPKRKERKAQAKARKAERKKEARELFRQYAIARELKKSLWERVERDMLEALSKEMGGECEVVESSYDRGT